MDVDTFVLMANHVHLLVTPETEKGVSQLMQSLGRYYVMYINKTYQHTGAIWKDAINRPWLIVLTTFCWSVAIFSSILSEPSSGLQAVEHLGRFGHYIPALTLQEIRDATNKAWVLSEDRFKRQIQQ
jgi:putative transposase